MSRRPPIAPSVLARRLLMGLVTTPWLTFALAIGCGDEPEPPLHVQAPESWGVTTSAPSSAPGSAPTAPPVVAAAPDDLVPMHAANPGGSPTSAAAPVTPSHASDPEAAGPEATARSAADEPAEPAGEDRAGEAGALAPPAGATLEVLEAAIATGVASREPVGAAAAFAPTSASGDPDARIWAWVKVRNPGEPTTVTMVWRHEGVERTRVALTVGTSPRWRTWSRRRISARMVGAWTVEVEDAEGRVLRRLAFTVAGEVGPGPRAAASRDADVAG